MSEAPVHEPADWRATTLRGGLRSVPWLLLVVLGPVPSIISDLITSRVPPWVIPVQVCTGIAVTLSLLMVRSVQRLWRFAAVLTAILALPMIVGTIDLRIPGVQAVLGGGNFNAVMQSGQPAKLLVTIAMIVLLLLMQVRPRAFFLRLGNRGARIRPAPLLGFPKGDLWRRFGMVWGIGIAGALAVTQFLLARPSGQILAGVLPLFPAIVLYAAMNSITEEMTYRAPVIATVEPVAGSGQALWLSAVSFGIAHYFGIPGGAIGALSSVFMGWILSKAMVETRGLFWPWLIHFFSDVVIFTFLAAGLAGG